jgi:CRISPR/Cas system CSM-associated protein Csm3 (group 7 of RAMP superfamily)
VTGIDVMQAELVAQTTWRCQEKIEMVGSWKAKIYDMHNVQVGVAFKSDLCELFWR